MVKKRIVIPRGLSCPECGSDNLIGHGTEWKTNPHSNNPPRIKMQKYKCNECGRKFVGGEVASMKSEAVNVGTKRRISKTKTSTRAATT